MRQENGVSVTRSFRAVVFGVGVLLGVFWVWVMLFALSWGGFGGGLTSFFGYGFLFFPLSMAFSAVYPRKAVVATCMVFNVMPAFVAIYILVREWLLLGVVLCIVLVLWYAFAFRQLLGETTESRHSTQKQP